MQRWSTLEKHLNNTHQRYKVLFKFYLSHSVLVVLKIQLYFTIFCYYILYTVQYDKYCWVIFIFLSIAANTKKNTYNMTLSLKYILLFVKYVFIYYFRTVQYIEYCSTYFFTVLYDVYNIIMYYVVLFCANLLQRFYSSSFIYFIFVTILYLISI